MNSSNHSCFSQGDPFMYIQKLPAIQDADEFFDYIIDLLDKYAKLGPIPGIMLPFIEAFLPFLPLAVFVMANSVAYGLLKGFLYSWIGSFLGSISVFLIIRKYSTRRFLAKVRNNKQVVRVTSWVDRHGFGLMFLLLCFPFSPSSVINIVAGLAKISNQRFILAVILGKAVMIFSLAYIGVSIFEFAKNPLKTSIIVICIVAFWGLGKFIEKRFINGQAKKRDVSS